MKELRTIILAAGKGTRMKSRTAKVLHHVCGRPMINYVLDAVKSAGSLESFIVLGHQNEQLKAQLPADIKVVLQKKLLGTADAVASVKKYFKKASGHVLVLCGDTPLLQKQTIKRLVANHKKSQADCTVLTSTVENPFGYGRIIKGPNGSVLAIREEKDAVGEERQIEEINVGVYCFRAEALFENLSAIKVNRKKKEYYLTDIIQIFSEKGLNVESMELTDAREGMGVNTREDLALSESILRQRIIKRLMLQGVTVIDPQTTYIDADVKIGQDTVIHPFTFIEGNVRIGSNCSLGPFARLRSGTRIGSKVVLGNFVEVSRSKIGDRCVMKHFGFLGDAVLGSNVNVGAGSVTANYDGKNKNKTLIGNNAFIGCDSILIAPVKIGKQATTGAGCVVTRARNVPDKSIVVGIPGKILKVKKN